MFLSLDAGGKKWKARAHATAEPSIGAEQRLSLCAKKGNLTLFNKVDPKYMVIKITF